MILAVLALPAWAREAEPVPVFTNEDLEALYGPSEAPDRPVVETVEGVDWEFVTAAIERGYARIDADRASHLARLRLEQVRPQPRYVVPYVAYGRVRPYRGPRVRPRPEPPASRLPKPPIGRGADSVPEGGRLPPTAVYSRRWHNPPQETPASPHPHR